MKHTSAMLDAIRVQLPEIEYRTCEPMHKHTSFKIGGSAAVMFFPGKQSDVTTLSSIMHGFGIRPLIIGNGTNLLVEDSPLDIAVIKTFGCLNEIRQSGDTEITAESGVLLSKLAAFALEHGLTGLEFAHGIPGTLGGAVLMNAGAYGGEMKNAVIKTTALTPGSAACDITGDAHEFSYRHSCFSDSDDVILSSVLRLNRGEPEEIKSRMDTLAKKRRDSQPLNIPSAGSTFKRPKEGYAAALIEQAGLKGFTVGGAMVSEKHAGFVVNRCNATFKDVMTVMDHIRDTVMSRFGIELEPEVRIIRSRQP